MATVSLLSAKMSEEARNNPGAPWSTVEAAVEVILNQLGVTELSDIEP